MKTAIINGGILESVLNEGLRVLCNVPEITEGELFRIVDLDGDNTRAFFARATFIPEPGVIQITLQPFMEALNPETEKWERIPMAGESANEKHTAPEGVENPWPLVVKGEKPVWIYRGVKWIMEISLSKLFFGNAALKSVRDGQGVAPGMLFLSVQAQGGEIEYAYRLLGKALDPALTDDIK